MTNSAFELNSASSTSDESFAPLTESALTIVPQPTSVDGEPHINDNLERVGFEEVSEVDVEQTLTQCLLLVRRQFTDNLIGEATRKDAEEDDNAALMSLGYGNALDWLDNKPMLYRALSAAKMAPETDNVKLLGQIAKLQLGDWKDRADGTRSWFVPRRRDERLGRFYRIFYADKAKYPRENLRQVILDHPGKSGGILKTVEVKKKAVGKAELAANRNAAKTVAPVAKVKNLPNDVRAGKQGQYRLALVSVSGNGLDICSIIEGEDALTERLADRWAAEAAMTVDTSEDGDADANEE